MWPAEPTTPYGMGMGAVTGTGVGTRLGIGESGMQMDRNGKDQLSASALSIPAATGFPGISFPEIFGISKSLLPPSFLAGVGFLWDSQKCIFSWGFGIFGISEAVLSHSQLVLDSQECFSFGIFGISEAVLPHFQLVLDSQKRVFSWGFGGYGRLGHAEQKDEMVPRLVKLFDFPGRGASQIYAGYTCSFAVSETGGSAAFGNAGGDGSETGGSVGIWDLGMLGEMSVRQVGIPGFRNARAAVSETGGNPRFGNAGSTVGAVSRTGGIWECQGAVALQGGSQGFLTGGIPRNSGFGNAGAAVTETGGNPRILGFGNSGDPCPDR